MLCRVAIQWARSHFQSSEFAANAKFPCRCVRDGITKLNQSDIDTWCIGRRYLLQLLLLRFPSVILVIKTVCILLLSHWQRYNYVRPQIMIKNDQAFELIKHL